MSRSAHAKSSFKLRKLPRCSRCKIEFILTLAHYERNNKLMWEWECPRCKKTVPKEYLQEERLQKDDITLVKSLEKLEKYEETKRNRRNSSAVV